MKTNWIAVVLAVSPMVARCQDSTAQETKPALSFQVLAQRKINLGNRSIVFNRVATPPPVPSTPPNAAEVITEPSESALRSSGKKHEAFFLNATVIDHKVTDVHLIWKNRDYRLFSNIDFNYLAGVGQVETKDSTYSVLLGVNNAQLGAPETKGVPSLQTFNQSKSEFVVETESMLPDDEALSVLDTLSTYYDANRQTLAAEYVKREVLRVEREGWLKAHPPTPKDTVIYFWPGAGGRVIEGPNRRSNP